MRQTLIDRLVGIVSPSAAKERMTARMTLERLGHLQREYDAARPDEFGARWLSRGGSANAEVQGSGAALRYRMRDLVRNNPIAASAVQVLVTNMVGAGIRPRANSRRASLNSKVDDLWARFSDRCDFHGQTDFHGLVALAVREMIEGGDALALRRTQPIPSGRARNVPLQIELKEADHLDDTMIRTTAEDGGRIVQGIEYDRDGRRVAYWLHPDHPGDGLLLHARQYKSVRVPADTVAHLFERQRVQDRGVPWGAPVMRAIRDVGDWQEAELARKRTEACLVGIVLTDDAGATLGPVRDGADGKVQELQPGMLATMRGAEDVKFLQPAAAGGVGEWNRVQLQYIASGFRVPYALLTGDLSQTSFSSSRVGLSDFRRMIEMMQWQMVIPQLCLPIWRWFCEAAYLAGLIDTPEVAVEWAPPGFPTVNAKQDAEADVIEVQAGFASIQQMIAKRGYDPQAVMDEQAAYLAALDARGMAVTSDGRRAGKPLAIAPPNDDAETGNAAGGGAGE